MTEALTQVSEFDHPADGYIVIAPLSEESRDKIYAVQDKFAERFGAENLWLPRGDQLHITFGHIVTPNVEYSENRTELFQRIRPFATMALERITANGVGIRSTFDTIQAFPSAVIIKARDDGSFERLRQDFIRDFRLPEGTRMPPNIIHATLLRFRHELGLTAVEQCTEDLGTSFEPFDEITHSLQLIHEQKIFVQEHEVLQTFS